MAGPKDRPIIFSGPMVRAILDGRKTQTRRVVKPQPPTDYEYEGIDNDGHLWLPEIADQVFWRRCPYGKSKDGPWVRETWHTDEIDLEYAKAKHEDICEPSPIFYRADTLKLHDPLPSDAGWRWRSSRCMPRWASRLTLDVLGVRGERLQDISKEDAIAEGLTEYFWPDDLHPDVCARVEGKRYWEHVIKKRSRRCSVWHSAILAYKELWNDINAKRKPVMDKGKVVSYISYPWRASIWDTCEHRGKPWVTIVNPWVWVIEFKIKES